MMEVLTRNKWIAFGAAAIVSICIAIAASRPALQTFIENAGVNIPTGDLLVDYATGMG